MSAWAAYYDVEYIQTRVKDAESHIMVAHKQQRFWQEMLDAKHSISTPGRTVSPPGVEELARDMFEGFARSWSLCTDQHYWRELARKLVDAGWRKLDLEEDDG